MKRYWADYPTTAYDAIEAERTIAILPVAAVEQHGPHLPVGVDTIINQGLLALLAERCPEDLDIRILPVQAVGKSNEHLHAPGTLTLTAETALRAWTEIGLSVARAGVRKMVIVNSHGGNVELMGIVARELRVQAEMLVAKAQWGATGMPEALYSQEELAFGIHGGDVETSMMLHFRPDLVDMGAARDFRSTAQDMDNFAHLRPTGATAYGWMAHDLNAAGTVGNAAIATAEKGAETADHYVAGMIALLSDVAAFDLSRLGHAR
ncbi:MAG: creatininase family protein [Pseudomonadota bacterium]